MSTIEEPRHDVELRQGAFEIRRYAPRVVAETQVDGAWNGAGNEGFRRLAGYIFGKNRGAGRIAMTAPVAQRPASSDAGRSGWTVAFTMPAGSTPTSLPAPDDPRVVVRAVPAARVGVVRFRGRWRTERMGERARALRAWLSERGLVPVGEPIVARYDPPWTPWFLRRNEVWLALDDAAAAPDEAGLSGPRDRA